jgi:hypothetical protein
MQSSKRHTEYHAAAVQIPEPGRALQRQRDECKAYRADRERVERISIVRGLILLALLVLAVSMARAGLDRVFVPYWWKP